MFAVSYLSHPAFRLLLSVCWCCFWQRFRVHRYWLTERAWKHRGMIGKIWRSCRVSLQNCEVSLKWPSGDAAHIRTCIRTFRTEMKVELDDHFSMHQRLFHFSNYFGYSLSSKITYTVMEKRTLKVYKIRGFLQNKKKWVKHLNYTPANVKVLRTEASITYSLVFKWCLIF